jgi:hypothetical protein
LAREGVREVRSTEIKENLNAVKLCERRDQIVTLLTKAMESLSEADLLLKTITTHGFSFDRNTIYSPSSPDQKMKTINILTKQADRKIWDHIIELGQFRDLMTVKEQRKISEQLEDCPPVTIETVTATFSSLLKNRPNMLQDLVETAFLERSGGYKSNKGMKINKRQVVDGVFCKYGFTNWGSRPCDRLDDITKAISKLLGEEKPHIFNILKVNSEYSAFGGKVRYKAFKNGNVHVWIDDKDLLDRLNDVLSGAMGAKVGNNE